MFNTPVLIIAWRRPEHLLRVIESLKQVQPKYVYVVVDGPRNGDSFLEERKLIEETKIIIDTKLDWVCQVIKLYRVANFGCGLSVSNAINWFFEQVEFGIILEDDTVPNVDFFYFAEEALKYFENDDKIMHISGSNYINISNSECDGFLTRIPFIWGWATWRRAWKMYDFNFKYLSILEIETILLNVFGEGKIKDYWLGVFVKFQLTSPSFTWDYQWFITIWKNNGFVLHPNLNMVENIGFDMLAVHTTNVKSHLNDIKSYKTKKRDFSFEGVLYSKQLEKANFDYYFIPYKKNKMIDFFKHMVKTLFKLFLSKLNINSKTTNRITTRNSIISDYSKLHSGKFINCKIGDYTYVSENARIDNADLGKFCSIGPNLLCGYGIHPLDGISTNPMFYSINRQNGFTLTDKNKVVERKRIFIGNDVFIGANVTILDGVNIGDGAVIGAGAVVSKDIPPYAIAVGVPIRILRFRFNEDVVEKLMKKKWWDWQNHDLHLIEKQFFNVNEFTKDVFK